MVMLEFLQRNLPWSVPYCEGFKYAKEGLPHLHGSHVALHAAKSVGKLCAAFEKADHGEEVNENTVRESAAELVIAALRLANLYDFPIGEEIMDRLEEKNGPGIWDLWQRSERLKYEDEQ